MDKLRLGINANDELQPDLKDLMENMTRLSVLPQVRGLCIMVLVIVVVVVLVLVGIVVVGVIVVKVVIVGVVL